MRRKKRVFTIIKLLVAVGIVLAVGYFVFMQVDIFMYKLTVLFMTLIFASNLIAKMIIHFFQNE